jgi:hypothetical protein
MATGTQSASKSTSHGAERRPMKRTKSSLLAIKLREVRPLPNPRAPRRLRTPCGLGGLCQTVGDASAARLGCLPDSAVRLPQRVSPALALYRSQFLDSKDTAGFDSSLLSSATCSDDARVRPASHERSRRPSDFDLRAPSREDAVWVDCFYYGFYIAKDKLPAFQASLRQQKAMQPKAQVAAAH